MKKMLPLALGIALLAAAGTAYAATTDTTDTSTSAATEPAISAKPFTKVMGKGSFKVNSTELQSLLGLDEAGLAQELAAGKSLAAIAEAKGVTKQQVVDLLVKEESARLDQAVKDGKITQAYADQQKTELTERIGKIVEQPGFGGMGRMGHMKDMKDMEGMMRGKAGDMGRGKGGFGGHEGRGGMGQSFGDAADATGMTQQEIIEQYRSGKSLSEIAEGKGITKDQLIDSLTEKQKERIKSFVDQKYQAPVAKAPAASAPTVVN
jgi:predicted DNA-binding protein YlxM (UPF0122 family)